MTVTAEPFVHPAFLYGDNDEYVAGCVRFIRDGLEADEPVAVSVPTANLELLRAALGDDAKRVVMHDMTVAGRNPGRIISSVLLDFANRHPFSRVRIIGEPIWAQRSEAEYPACAQHEALINPAFQGRAVTILCPYNTRELDAAWLFDAHRTHPVLWSLDGYVPSQHFADPIATAAEFAQPLPEPAADAATMTTELLTLGQGRRFVHDYATRAGLTASQAHRVVLVVNELATNAIQYGDETPGVSVWIDDLHLICQVETTGQITDPLAGRIPAMATAGSGRGLLLINQLCDLVRMHSGPSGTTTRVYIRRP
jgi:anti-sigma regulatory factor (Ser/Thr protein kinase)